MFDQSPEPIIPKLTPEIMEAAQALAENDWLNLRQHRDAECSILNRPAAAVNTWVLRGLQHDFDEASRQLRIAREVEGRWKDEAGLTGETRSRRLPD
jgi:hypothetical protein